MIILIIQYYIDTALIIDVKFRKSLEMFECLTKQKFAFRFAEETED